MTSAPSNEGRVSVSLFPAAITAVGTIGTPAAASSVRYPLLCVPLHDREWIGDRSGQLIENGKKFVEALGVVPGRPDQNQVGVDIEEGRARPRRHRRRDAVGGESFHDEFAFDIRLAGGAVTGEQENRGHATMLSRLAPCTTSEVAPRRGPATRSRVARLRPPTSPRRCRRGGASSSPR